MAYASTQVFGGQRASAGRTVVLAVKSDDGGRWLRAGVIVGVSSRKDQPHIRDLATNDIDWSHPWQFHDAKTEADLAEMPIGSWAWPPPPRV